MKIRVRLQWEAFNLKRPWYLFVENDNDYWRDGQGQAYSFKTIQQGEKFLSKFTTTKIN